MKPHRLWRVSCSCGYEREATSAWAATAIFRLHVKLILGARQEEQPGDRPLHPRERRGRRRRLAPRGDRHHHEREARAEPRGEPEKVDQPEQRHQGAWLSIRSSTGCRPAKPPSISCQWVIRSSP